MLAVPFLLPEMHERYFYLADVLAILAAFHVRRFWPVAVVVNLCSVLSYAPFLWNRSVVALPLVAFAEIGFAVAFGVLLDTLVVRSVLVTALNLDIGRWMWWPSKLTRIPDEPKPVESELDLEPVP